MARAGITYDQVQIVCDRMLADGEKPTVSNVREALGNTGSNNTILKHLQVFRATMTPVERPAPVIDETIIASIQESIERSSASARVDAEEQLNDVKTELRLVSEEVDTVNDFNDELQSQNKSLIDKNTKVEILSEEAHAKILKLEAELKAERVEAEEVNTKLTQAITAHDLLVKQEAELKDELKVLRLANDNFVTANTALNAQLAKAQTDNEQLAKNLGDAERIIGEQKKELTIANDKMNEALNDQGKLNERSNAQAKEIITLEATITELKPLREKVTSLIAENNNKALALKDADHAATLAKNEVDRLKKENPKPSVLQQ